jgi:hypothetical protein
MSKFKFPIDPERIYTLQYNNRIKDVTGIEILKFFLSNDDTEHSNNKEQDNN